MAIFDFTTEINNTITLALGDTLSFGTRSAAKVSFLKNGADVTVQYHGINGIETVNISATALSALDSTQFTFDSGDSISVLGATQITAGQIVGTDFSDIITGGVGAQSLIGGVGNDTYVFSKGDGADVIVDLDVSIDNIDTISFADVLTTDVLSITDSVLRDGNNLIVKYGATDQITVVNYFDPANSNQVIEQIQFSDGAIWDQTTINTAPVFNAFTTAVASGNEDTPIAVTFADLQTAGNQTTTIGSVTAFIIKSVDSGSLLIGTDQATASAWDAILNNTVDATHIAYWTPTLNDNGTLNAFTAVAKDSIGIESTTLVQATIAVAAVNDAPIVATTDLIGAISELDIPVGNITDSGTITFTDAELTDIHTVSITATSTTPLGTLTPVITADTTGTGTGGIITWDYSVAAADLEYLAAGQTKVETFTITLLDGNGGSVDRTVSVTLTGTNDVPTINTSTLTGSITEQLVPTGIISNNTSITFSDIDITDSHSVTVTPITANALGTVTANISNDTTGTGLGGIITWNYNVAATAVEYLAVGQTKLESFTVTLLDGKGGAVDSTVNVTITGTNDVPVVATTDLIGAIAEPLIAVGDITDTGIVTFTDVDLTDAHSISVTSTSATPLGTFTPTITTDTTGTGTGGVITWNYTVPATAIEYLTAGQTKVETFTMTLLDGNGGSVDRTVSVTITGTNHLPVVSASNVSIAGTNINGTITELATPVGNLTNSGTITFTDVDVTDTHTVSVTATSANALGTLTPAVTTDTTGTGTGGVITWNYSVAATALESLALGQTKLETFTVRLNDGFGGIIDRPVNILLTGTNDAPIAVNDTLTAIQDTASVYTASQLVGNDTDVDTGTVLTIASVTSGSNGTAILNADGRVTFTPNATFTGVANFTYVTTDGITLSNPATATVNVNLLGPQTFLATLGNDSFDGKGTNDTVVYSSGANSGVTVDLSKQPLQQTTLGSGLDTLVGIEHLIGSNFNDRLTGDIKNNNLNGGAGADTLTGGAGDDSYVVDIIPTGVLADTVIEAAGAGTDNMLVQGSYAGAAAQTITAPANVELIDISLTATSKLNVSAVLALSNTTIIGNDAGNLITGSTGNNIFTGGIGADTINGGGGTDVYNVNLTSAGLLEDAVTGGTGLDTIIVTGTSTNATASTLIAGATIEVYNVAGTGGSKLNLTGNALANNLTANAANNTIDGLAGADIMIGGLGDDTYVVDNIGDVVTENLAEGTDLINSSISFNLATSGNNIENLTLTGIGPINGTGSAVNNIITGNTGNNILSGGNGDDTFFVQNAGDSVVENLNEGFDTVNSSVTFVLGANIENLNLSGITAINGKGNALANVITGNTAANVLDDGSAAAIDTLVGGAGNDTYVLANIDDIITELAGGGTDTISVTSTYTLHSANVENLTLTGTTNINATGDAGANLITGNAGANILTGATGVDTMVGGGGNDIYNANITSTGLLEDVVTGGTGVDTILVAGTSTNIAATTLTAAAVIENYNISATGGSLLNITGNALTNILTGNDANNILSDGAVGGLGDTLIGGLGNDTYTVNNSTDKITESVGQGTDLVNSSVTFNLLNALNVENLTLTGLALSNATGNNDANILTGNTAINLLSGNDGNDTLIGKGGNDLLTGGLGADIFWYDTAANATNNKDTVTDFATGVDKLQFSGSVLAGLGITGQFAVDDQRFWSAANGLAHDTTDILIFNTTTGVLSYDSDGNGRALPIAIEVIAGTAPIATDIWSI